MASRSSSSIRQLTRPSSLQLSAAITTGPAVINAASATELALILSEITIVDFSTTADEWSWLANTTYMNTERLNLDVGGFDTFPAPSILTRDMDGDRLHVQYN